MNGFDQAVTYTEFGLSLVWEATKASIGEVSGNFTPCIDNTTDVYLQTGNIYREYERQLYTEAGLSTYALLTAADPIIFSCYFAVFESNLAVTMYFDTLSDWNKLLFNLAHNLGNIYDLSEEFVYRMIDSPNEYQNPFFYQRVGFMSGALVQDLLELPDDYLPFDEINMDYLEERNDW